MNQVILNTEGTGLWTDVAKAIRIVDMRIGYIDDEFDQGESPNFGELRVYFDQGAWDLVKHGLIYTDPLFLRELREFLTQHGLPGKDVDYSEQGMQSAEYVSLDVGGFFLEAWGVKFGIDWESAVADPRGIQVACRG